MASSLKQFASLISSFVDNSLMPIIQSKMPESYRVVQQWKQLKNIINEGEIIQIWKIEKLVNSNASISKKQGVKQISIESLDKHSINPPNRTHSSLFQCHSWKYPKVTDGGSTLEAQNNDKRQSYQLQIGLSDAVKMKDKKSDQNLQSFEALLGSFRKLCTNFENNHKKLIRDRQSLPL